MPLAHVDELACCQNHETLPLAELELHAWRLKEILEEPDVAGSILIGEGRFRDVAAWLTCAAGLRTVDIDSGRYSGAAYMCRGAAEWDAARNEELMAVTRELTRVMFVWNALERAGRALGLAAPNGMAVALSAYVGEHLATADAPTHYECAMRNLRKLVPADEKNFADVRRVLRRDASDVCLGLRAGSKLRNLLVHGVVKLPAAETPELALRSQVALGIATSRALLFGLQMVLLVDSRLTSASTLVYEPSSGDDLPLPDVVAIAHLAM